MKSRLKLIFKFISSIILAGALLFLFSMFGWKWENRKDHRNVVPVSDYLNKAVVVLSRDIGHRDYTQAAHLDQAKVFIKKEFEKFGYKVEEQVYAIDQIPEVKFSNLIARRAPKSDRSTLVIGAHYDSCDNPGADDNASGVAGMLALAQMFKDHPASEDIEFVAFVNEEPPFFATDMMGSRHYVRQIQESGRQIRGAIILEMIGYYSDRPFSQRYLPMTGFTYPNQGHFLVLVGNQSSSAFTKGLFQHLKDKPFPFEMFISPLDDIPGVYYSDHWSFWREGYPAVMVTDTAFLRNPHYHKDSDTSETLDYESMARAMTDLADALKGVLQE